MSSTYGPDGEADFSKYSDAELKQACIRIDFAIHPIDHERVRAEQARRKQKRRYKLQPLMQKAVGGYLLAGGVFLLALGGNHLLQTVRLDAGPPVHPVMVIAITAALIVGLLSLAAGVLIVRKRPHGACLGIAILSLQLLSFRVAQVEYRMVPLAAFSVGWQSPFTFWFSLNGGPEVMFRWSAEPSWALGADLVSLNALLILGRGLRRKRLAGRSVTD